MMKYLMLIAALMLAIGSTQAIAQDGGDVKTKFYNFDDLLIDGQYKKPQVLYTDARQKVKFERLLKLTHTEAGTGFTVSVSDNPPSLTVADQGSGLPSPDVFDRGSTTGESSGLGLDIVRRIAEASGGEVRIGDGPGATIVVRFGRPADAKAN